MSRIVMDASLADNLRRVGEAVEIVDEAGRVVGVYTPVLKYLPPPGYKFPLSDEELDRRNQVRTGRSLDEILIDLKAKYGE